MGDDKIEVSQNTLDLVLFYLGDFARALDPDRPNINIKGKIENIETLMQTIALGIENHELTQQAAELNRELNS